MDKMTVDDFVKRKVLPEFQPIVVMIRELMKECAPAAQEVISYGIPVYKVKRIIESSVNQKGYYLFLFARHGV
jgi:uncharacterized protein YdhG (YjbR/CyaY superfamily)